MDVKAFFKTLASDPNAMAEYKKNPGAAMKAAGLSEDHVAAVKSGNVDLIKKAVDGAVAADTVIVLIL